jgi:hypothetical protein
MAIRLSLWATDTSQPFFGASLELRIWQILDSLPAAIAANRTGRIRDEKPVIVPLVYPRKSSMDHLLRLRIAIAAGF